jgi:succinate dehydrogenase flavin-adding protein (antitoxin of CptAB toxin-antitoxin module)
MLILSSNNLETFSTILDKSDEIILYIAINVEKIEKRRHVKNNHGNRRRVTMPA